MVNGTIYNSIKGVATAVLRGSLAFNYLSVLSRATSRLVACATINRDGYVARIYRGGTPG